MKKSCCGDWERMKNAFAGMVFRIGNGEIIRGSLEITSNGWNDLPFIAFNYCPFCGKKKGDDK